MLLVEPIGRAAISLVHNLAREVAALPPVPGVSFDGRFPPACRRCSPMRSSCA